MKKTTILAGASALVLTLGGVGTTVAQAKATTRAAKHETTKKHTTKKPAAKKPAKKHAKKKPAAKKPAVTTPVAQISYPDAYGASGSTTGDGTGSPNVLDALAVGPGETALPDLGLVTDVVQGLLGQPLG
jgi:hypothetical protein